MLRADCLFLFAKLVAMHSDDILSYLRFAIYLPGTSSSPSLIHLSQPSSPPVYLFSFMPDRAEDITQCSDTQSASVVPRSFLFLVVQQNL